jgi:branched-chain amino acid transport system permease protein
MCVLWGYTGIFSFGQSAFFGIAGYVYGLVAINTIDASGNTNVAVVAGLASALLLAAVVGYVLFFGGVNFAYAAIFTLMLTMVFELFMTQTAGPEYTFGKASLGGYNGMTGIPPITGEVGAWRIEFTGAKFYYLTVGLLVATYLGLRILVNSRIGYAMIAVREDRARTEMFGYDVRLVELGVFILAGGLAGVSGVLFSSWNNIITPPAMGITAATLPVIWVAAAGRRSLIAVIASTYGLQWVNQHFSISSPEYALVILAMLVLVIVLVLPGGVAGIGPLIDKMLLAPTKYSAGRVRSGRDDG